MNVAKVIGMTSTSTKSFEDAVRLGTTQATDAISDVRVA